jgi:hypothetical protein
MHFAHRGTNARPLAYAVGTRQKIIWLYCDQNLRYTYTTILSKKQ